MQLKGDTSFLETIAGKEHFCADGRERKHLKEGQSQAFVSKTFYCVLCLVLYPGTFCATTLRSTRFSALTLCSATVCAATLCSRHFAQRHFVPKTLNS